MIAIPKESPGCQLYQETIARNFEIIGTLLANFPVISKKLEQIDLSVKSVTQKYGNYERENKEQCEVYDRKINLLEKKITDLADPNKADSRERKRSHRAVVNSTETISKPRKYSVIVKAAHLEEEQMNVDQKWVIQQIQAKTAVMNEQIESMSKQIYYWTSLNEQSFATIDSVEERFAETATNMAIIKQQVQQQINKLNINLVSSIECEFKQLKEQQAFREEINHFSENKGKKKTNQNKDDQNNMKTEISLIKTTMEHFVDQIEQKFADREETRKALMLLETKLVRIDLTLLEYCNLNKVVTFQEQIKDKKYNNSQSQRNLIHSSNQYGKLMSAFGRSRKLM